jgi:hypothetical protein
MVAHHRIAVQVGMHDPYWVQVREAVIRHAIQRHVEVVQLGTFTVISPIYSYFPTKSMSFRRLLVQDVHGLICNTVAEPLLRRIVARGIPIIDASESFLRYPLFTSRRGLYDAAHTVGRWLAERVQPNARILIVGGYDDMGLSPADWDTLMPLPRFREYSWYTSLWLAISETVSLPPKHGSTLIPLPLMLFLVCLIHSQVPVVMYSYAINAYLHIHWLPASMVTRWRLP